MVMQLLLRKQAGSLPATEWSNFLRLQSHLDDLRKIGPEEEDQFAKLKDILVMSHAAWKFSGVPETADFVESVTARVRGLHDPNNIFMDLIQGGLIYWHIFRLSSTP